MGLRDEARHAEGDLGLHPAVSPLAAVILSQHVLSHVGYARHVLEGLVGQAVHEIELDLALAGVERPLARVFVPGGTGGVEKIADLQPLVAHAFFTQERRPEIEDELVGVFWNFDRHVRRHMAFLVPFAVAVDFHGHGLCGRPPAVLAPEDARNCRAVAERHLVRRMLGHLDGGVQAFAGLQALY